MPTSLCDEQNAKLIRRTKGKTKPAANGRRFHQANT